jgi:membrane associated rhomboid family serine protease
MTDQEPPWIEVFRAEDKRVIQDASLVLLAVKVAHRVDMNATTSPWSLMVPPQEQARAHQELTAYWEENSKPPPAKTEVPTVDSGWLGVLGFLAVIWAVPALEGFSNASVVDAGVLHSEAVTQGQWWRAVTALTLHGGLEHILSNSLFGSLFGFFVARYLGSGVGWLTILGCATLANLLNAYVHPNEFRALGASTANFAALGLAPTLLWRKGAFREQDWRRNLAPIFAAVTMLVFTGFGSELVDVGGHLAGFAFGVIAGLQLSQVDFAAISVQRQQQSGILAVALVALCWILAL